jgi:chemotaxis response regulator CheB
VSLAIRVLVVDDTVIMRRLIRQALSIDAAGEIVGSASAALIVPLGSLADEVAERARGGPVQAIRR